MHAAVVLAPPFTDGAVLQRGQPVPVWGTADSGEKVTVAFAGQSLSTTADEQGRWRVNLPPLPLARWLRPKRTPPSTDREVSADYRWSC